MQLTMALVELRGTLVNGFFKKLSNTFAEDPLIFARAMRKNFHPACGSVNRAATFRPLARRFPQRAKVARHLRIRKRADLHRVR